MSSTVTVAAQSTELQSLDEIRPQMVKAVHRSPLLRQALIAACGTLKAAAITMAMDQSQLGRDIDSGKFNFERIAALSDIEQARFYQRLHEETRPLLTPMARLREIERLEEALRRERWEIVEGLAS